MRLSNKRVATWPPLTAELVTVSPVGRVRSKGWIEISKELVKGVLSPTVSTRSPIAEEALPWADTWKVEVPPAGGIPETTPDARSMLSQAGAL